MSDLPVAPEHCIHPSPPARNEALSTAIDLLSGTIGGCTGIVGGQPFDTIKVRLQAAARGTYKSAMDCLRQTVRKEGVSGTVCPGSQAARAISAVVPAVVHVLLEYCRC